MGVPSLVVHCPWRVVVRYGARRTLVGNDPKPLVGWRSRAWCMRGRTRCRGHVNLVWLHSAPGYWEGSRFKYSANRVWKKSGVANHGWPKMSNSAQELYCVLLEVSHCGSFPKYTGLRDDRARASKTLAQNKASTSASQRQRRRRRSSVRGPRSTKHRHQ